MTRTYAQRVCYVPASLGPRFMERASAMQRRRGRAGCNRVREDGAHPERDEAEAWGGRVERIEFRGRSGGDLSGQPWRAGCHGDHGPVRALLWRVFCKVPSAPSHFAPSSRERRT